MMAQQNDYTYPPLQVHELKDKITLLERLVNGYRTAVEIYDSIMSEVIRHHTPEMIYNIPWELRMLAPDRLRWKAEEHGLPDSVAEYYAALSTNERRLRKDLELRVTRARASSTAVQFDRNILLEEQADTSDQDLTSSEMTAEDEDQLIAEDELQNAADSTANDPQGDEQEDASRTCEPTTEAPTRRKSRKRYHRSASTSSSSSPERKLKKKYDNEKDNEKSSKRRYRSRSR